MCGRLSNSCFDGFRWTKFEVENVGPAVARIGPAIIQGYDPGVFGQVRPPAAEIEVLTLKQPAENDVRVRVMRVHRGDSRDPLWPPAQLTYSRKSEEAARTQQRFTPRKRQRRRVMEDRR